MSKQEKLLAMKPWPIIDYEAHPILGLWTFEETRSLELMTRAVLRSPGHGSVFPMAAQLSKLWKGQPMVRHGHDGPGKQVRASFLDGTVWVRFHPGKVSVVKSSGDNSVVNT